MMKKLFAAFGLLLALTACETEQAPPPAHVSHVMPPKISLDVQVINLADRSGLQPVNSPYNRNRFTPTISDAIKQWAGDRLQAAGQIGQAIIVIKDASLIEQPLPVSQGIDGWFTRQQGTKYIGHAEVSIEATGREGFALADAVATRAITLPENPSPIERQDAYFSLLNGLMKDLGQNLETGIQTHMGNFIVTPQVYGVTAVPTGNDVYAGSPGSGEAPVIIQSPAPQQMNGMQMGNARQSPPPMQLSGMQMTDTQLSGVPVNGMYGQQQSMNSAVANATMPMPPQVPVSPPTMTISQAQPAQYYDPSTSYGTQGNMGQPAGQSLMYASTAPSSSVTQMPLPPPPQQQPGAVYGTSSMPTVPDLASSPSSFSQPPQQADMSQYSANGSNNSYVYAPPPPPQMANNYSSYSQAPPQSVYTNYNAMPPPSPAGYAAYGAPPDQQAQNTYPQNSYASYNAPPQQPGPSSYNYVPTPPLPQPSYANNYGTYAAAAPMQPAPRGAPATIPLSGTNDYYAQ